MYLKDRLDCILNSDKKEEQKGNVEASFGQPDVQQDIQSKLDQIKKSFLREDLTQVEVRFKILKEEEAVRQEWKKLQIQLSEITYDNNLPNKMKEIEAVSVRIDQFLVQYKDIINDNKELNAEIEKYGITVDNKKEGVLKVALDKIGIDQNGDLEKTIATATQFLSVVETIQNNLSLVLSSVAVENTATFGLKQQWKDGIREMILSKGRQLIKFLSNLVKTMEQQATTQEIIDQLEEIRGIQKGLQKLKGWPEEVNKLDTSVKYVYEQLQKAASLKKEKEEAYALLGADTPNKETALGLFYSDIKDLTKEQAIQYFKDLEKEATTDPLTREKFDKNMMLATFCVKALKAGEKTDNIIVDKIRDQILTFANDIAFKNLAYDGKNEGVPFRDPQNNSDLISINEAQLLPPSKNTYLTKAIKDIAQHTRIFIHEDERILVLSNNYFIEKNKEDVFSQYIKKSDNSWGPSIKEGNRDGSYTIISNGNLQIFKKIPSNDKWTTIENNSDILLGYCLVSIEYSSTSNILGLQALATNYIVHKIPVLEGQEREVGKDQLDQSIVNRGTVSTSHLKIKIENGKILIQDVGSANGTYIKQNQQQQQQQ